MPSQVIFDQIQTIMSSEIAPHLLNPEKRRPVRFPGTQVCTNEILRIKPEKQGSDKSKQIGYTVE